MGAFKSPLIMGIETSCDETAVAILDGQNILSNVVSSQVQVHAKYGGVVPEIAARQHLEAINILIEKSLEESKKTFGELDAIAVTIGPGLIIALLVGITTAKAISYALSIPLIGVNHLEGHIYASFIENKSKKPQFPLIALLASGGHTSLVYAEDHGRYKTLGSTLDDAAGEAFDKIAKFLGLKYPGGPAIENCAASGNPDYYRLPRPMIDRKGYDFSFSGLKTAVVNLVKSERGLGRSININDLCASFQKAVIDVLVSKTAKATRELNAGNLVISGGVASNSVLRKAFTEHCTKYGISLNIPPPSFCTDNAAMIAMAAYYKYKRKEFIGYDFPVSAVLPLDTKTNC